MNCIVISGIVQYVIFLCAILFLLWFSMIEIFYQNGQCSSINVTKFVFENNINTSMIDSRLKLNHFTILGTHNSYHKANLFYHYSHQTIDQQLSVQIRQLEIDVHLIENNLLVYHLQLFDDRTNCYCFKSCLMKLAKWLNENPTHYPIYLFIEIKQMLYEDFVTGITGIHCQHFQQMQDEILNIFSSNTFILPNQIQGNQSSISLALKSQRLNEIQGDYSYYNYGWPPLSQSIGKIIPVFLDDVHNRAVQLYSQCNALSDFFLVAQSNINLTYSSIITVSGTSDIDKLIQIETNGQISRILLGYGTDNLDQIYQSMKIYGIHIISSDSEQCNDTAFCQSIQKEFKNSPVLCNTYYAPSFCNLPFSDLSL